MKFYETNWFLWLTLILCAPIGIFVLWRFHAEETTRLKMIMSIIFLALFIGVIALGVHFVKGDDHRAQDQKPAKETTEEDTGDEIEEEIGSLAFVFSPNNVTVVGNEAKNVIVSNVDEREEVVWSIDDPDIAYIESAVGNSCMIVGVGEGETVLKAKDGFVLRNVIDEYILMPVDDTILQFDGAVLLNEGSKVSAPNMSMRLVVISII